MTLPPLPSTGRTTWPNDDWARMAACRSEHGQAVMFGHRCNGKCFRNQGRLCERSDRVAYAKGICEGCPVLAHCRMWALDSELPQGMAGAMTEAERHGWYTRYGFPSRSDEWELHL